MTAPMPQQAGLTASTEVRQDPQGNVIVVLRMSCGPMSSEYFIAPDDAERFGEGIANTLKVAADQAKSLKPAILIPPKNLIIPRTNGGRS
jgi:DsbC/DsbD-like thiol-disulfide interchange protein